MSCAHLRDLISLAPIRGGSNWRKCSRVCVATCGVENGEIAQRGLIPGHAPAGGVGALAHRMPTDVIGEQRYNFLADGSRIAKRHQYAAPLCEKLLGMPIGSRNDGSSQTETVSQRAGSHLSSLEIGRDVDVAHRDQQSGLVDELIKERDVGFNAKL